MLAPYHNQSAINVQFIFHMGRNDLFVLGITISWKNAHKVCANIEKTLLGRFMCSVIISNSTEFCVLIDFAMTVSFCCHFLPRCDNVYRVQCCRVGFVIWQQSDAAWMPFSVTCDMQRWHTTYNMSFAMSPNTISNI